MEEDPVANTGNPKQAVNKPETFQKAAEMRNGMTNADSMRISSEHFSKEVKISTKEANNDVNKVLCEPRVQIEAKSSTKRKDKRSAKRLVKLPRIDHRSERKPKSFKITGDTHTCWICKKSYKHSGSLHKHLQIHKGDRNYKCESCDKTFIIKSALHCHMKVHSDKKPFECDVCQAAFRYKDSLKIHYRKHTDQRPYACPTCGKAFRQRNHLHVHLLMHTDRKPVTCKICCKEFAKNSLKVHMRTHSGERPFACSYCDKRFTQKTVLNVHIRIHTGERPFQCHTCGKSFGSKSDLSKHVQIHTDQRKYVCDVCHKGYTVKSNLRVHMRKHSGEKPYSCDLCDKKFSRKESLPYHMQTHERAMQVGVKQENVINDPLMSSQDVCEETSQAENSNFHFPKEKNSFEHLEEGGSEYSGGFEDICGNGQPIVKVEVPCHSVVQQTYAAL